MTLQLEGRVGSQVPTLLHLPANREDASRADDLAEVADIAGMDLDDWQHLCLREAAWLRRRGRGWRWSAMEAGIEVPRQNGKGDVKIVRQLTGLFVWGERLQVHTAHEFKTCYEHFRKVADIVENTPEFSKLLKPRVGIRTGAGDQAIELRNGNRIRFLARSGKSGRGLTGDVVYLDEAFALEPGMIGALMYALRARPNPQVWYTSSAPHMTSMVLHAMRHRAEATTAEEPRLLYVGWNNAPTASPGDVDGWYRVNPALGVRVDIETMANEYRNALSHPDLMAEFRREALGIPEEPGGEIVVPLPLWESLCDPAYVPTAPLVFAVDVTPDRSSATVAACGGGVVEVDNRAGTAWIAKRLTAHRGARVVVDAGSPAGALIPELERSGLKVESLGLADVAKACGAFYDDIADSRVRFRTNVALDDAVKGAVKKPVGDAWRWARRDTSVDMSPLVAATLAYWLARTHKTGSLFVAVT